VPAGRSTTVSHPPVAISSRMGCSSPWLAGAHPAAAAWEWPRRRLRGGCEAKLTAGVEVGLGELSGAMLIVQPTAAR
jgi:hypothetical protein